MGTQLGYEDERPPHSVFVDRFELDPSFRYNDFGFRLARSL